ncbi:MAG TPA: pyridoxine 5'-phosphate synthase [Pseudomonadales bacterium]|nr:pyridoxine 5'-phosphate synthase [Pseudomonadales bacterium]
MVALSVNINKIALLRNSRNGNFPDLLQYAKHCIALGADGITVHPRPDQRHIRASDIPTLKTMLAAFPAIEFNIEGNPFAPSQGSYPGFMALVEQSRPDQCTLVPDSDAQLTSDHGFDLKRDGERLQPVIAQLHTWGCRVSLFMDPDCEQITLAKKIGADRIELYTGPYAEACTHGNSDAINTELQRHATACQHADDIGLGVNAGHDLNLDNLPALVRALPALLEVSIGHALTIDALQQGLANTITAYKRTLSLSQPASKNYAN